MIFLFQVVTESEPWETLYPLLKKWLPKLHMHISNHQNVIVHCKGGICRSRSVTLAYFVFMEGRDPMEIKEMIGGVQIIRYWEWEEERLEKKLDLFFKIYSKI